MHVLLARAYSTIHQNVLCCDCCLINDRFLPSFKHHKDILHSTQAPFLV